VVGHDWAAALAWVFASVAPAPVDHLVAVSLPPPPGAWLVPPGGWSSTAAKPAQINWMCRSCGEEGVIL
jgi:pimeloyl-ACP methyl ester carboxylesterase